MATFAKPENALKRAEELMNVGQKQAALQALHDLITSKRYRSWQKTLETIMFKYVQLCVEMRKGRFAKDGLIQYRIVCQQVNVSSLEEVIKYFLHLSTDKAEKVQAEAHAQAQLVLDVDDLEAVKRPEDLMLSYVSGEKGKDRSDRELITPWFKFLWETYRTVLDILRNNSKVEALYAMTAHRAFHFCLQYKRSTEFRRLCEIIRNHLNNLIKYRDQRDRPDLGQPESLQLYLDTRFEQLKVATELELWQEAFRSVEDIHGLMVMVKKTPKPQMMAVYYAKLTKIFWMSRSYLYHAYAWFKLFVLQRSFNKNLSQKDLQLMASSVLLAAMSVMPYDHTHGVPHSELENEKNRDSRIASLLGFTVESKRDTGEVLSRSGLLSELVSKGVMTYVLQEVKDLYNLLENEFHPLDLASKAQPLLDKLSKLSDKMSSASPVPEVQLEQYVLSLERLTTLRVLQQVSQVYQTMRIEFLSKKIIFFSFSTFEKLAVEAEKYNFIQMKIDHFKGVVHFGSHDLESDKIRNHLSLLAKRLSKARMLIQPPAERVSRAGPTTPFLLEAIEKEHKKLLARKVLIERRKEEHERQVLEMEREEESKRIKQQRQTAEAEQKRLAIEYTKREEQRIRREIEEKEIEEAQALLHETVQRKGKKAKKIAIEGEKLTKQSLMEHALTEQLKERQEMERKIQKLVKTMDYIERAKREEEKPLIEAAYRKRLQDDEIFFDNQQQQAIRLSREKHTADLAQKNRFLRMSNDKIAFENQVVNRRQGEFQRLKREREERLRELRAIWKQDRDRRRKIEYYKREQEARLIRQKEEEEAQKRQEEETKRKMEADRLAKLDEIAAKQRQREKELEERDKQGKEALSFKEEPKLQKPTELGTGKFIPPHLRQKMMEKAGGAHPAEDTKRHADHDRIRDTNSAQAPAMGNNKYVPPSHGRFAGDRAPAAPGRSEARSRFGGFEGENGPRNQQRGFGPTSDRWGGDSKPADSDTWRRQR